MKEKTPEPKESADVTSTEDKPLVQEDSQDPQEEDEGDDTMKNEEPDDPHLHSLLLCTEEIPRSPAPPTEMQSNPMEMKHKVHLLKDL